ncbi:MAG: pyridoxal phosphate-dependent aminotransferase [Oscillospiraceae bacterium]|nr:pyridoxal phosphate-dependent aminotransferase [Oscillospiraceae bacterium]
MAAYSFDTVIDRRNTNSLKYDFAAEHGLPEDVLPLWVADMDFPAPEPVLQALRRAVDHGIFGYSNTKGDYYEAVSGWFRERFGWRTQPEWMVKTPGVVFALAAAVRALTAPGDAILVQPPVYYPFFSVIRDNQRQVVENRLVYTDGRYEIDFADFERKIAESHVKMFFLCSPHNPVGRVWTAEELRRLGGVCQRYGVFVVSDEIHCDFAFPDHPHTIFLEANPHLARQAIVCTAPSKTFNLAGLQASNIWIPDSGVRERFRQAVGRSGYAELNALGLVACQAAYQHGGEWLEACRTYMRDNLAFLRGYLAAHIPQVRLVEPEGTYFAWLDCSGLGLSDQDLDRLIIHGAKLWLDAGHIFGGDAGQFQRVVLACPRATLQLALERLARAVKGDKQG